jgi:hypothetical protein
MIIETHQFVISYLPDKDFTHGVHQHAFSEKWSKYEEYDIPPEGKGLWTLLVNDEEDLYLPDKEAVYSHPAFSNFSNKRTRSGLEHPPMPGLIGTAVRRNGTFLGLMMASDPVRGNFIESDIRRLRRAVPLVASVLSLQYIIEAKRKQASMTFEEAIQELENARE